MVSRCSTYCSMNSKHKKIMELVFKKPQQAAILWADIESLFVALGAEVSEGAGSRVRHDGI